MVQKTVCGLSTVSIGFDMSNENLPKQCTYPFHVNKIKCTLHPKKQVLKG